ncbi:FtsX-like permease family protein [Bacillus cereus group sp. MYBK234-1]|uniref:FtsX-like permease family protein n=1 Tax=unclassified Bacillus cereus group TaxID=2750818 RepID=UPI003F79A4CF
MTFQQFAFNNIIRSKRTYLAHFLSSTFAIMIFFTYALLTFHPNFQGSLVSNEEINTLATTGFQITQGLIFFFSFFFILYSVSAFLKTRKKEFGILMLHGMSRSQLNKLIFIENILIGVASILTGVTLGVVFSKFILIMSNSVLFIEKGLPFYLPFQAIGITFVVFFFLFLVISMFTSRMVKVTQLVELFQAEKKPNPEPKASLWLSLFALINIGVGYIVVLQIGSVTNKAYGPFMLIICVLLVTWGTYFLFTQLSVYVLRSLKKRENIFLKKTNLLTISDLVYQLKDNAKLLFMVTIISTVAFTAIGTCLTLNNGQLAEGKNPYAFKYESNQGNELEQTHLSTIKKQLTDAGFDYKQVSFSYKWVKTTLYKENGKMISLTDYNKLAQVFQYPQEQLQNVNKVLVIPNKKIEDKNIMKDFQLIREKADEEHPDRFGPYNKELQVQKKLSVKKIQGKYTTFFVVDDSIYNQIEQNSTAVNGFIVKDWIETTAVSKKILSLLNKDKRIGKGNYSFLSLSIEWGYMKNTYGLLAIMTVLIGIVFFTFAASFIYFRLYTNLEQSQQQYKMIAKIGLSKMELNKVITRQLLLIFFLPMVIASIHSSVAFIALQQIIDVSTTVSALLVLGCFMCIQAIYFFFVRSQYLKQMYRFIF